MPQKASDTHTAAPDGDRLLTIDQVAQWAQITPRTLRALWAEGNGPRRLRIGGSIRIRWSDALSWAESRPVAD